MQVLRKAAPDPWQYPELAAPLSFYLQTGAHLSLTDTH